MNGHSCRSSWFFVSGFLMCASAWAQTTTRASVSSAGIQATDDSLYPAISGDGRYVAFQSAGTGLVVGDTNGHKDIFVRDRLNEVTTRVSVGVAGAQANGDSDFCSISADGRFVAFRSFASNLISPDANSSAPDVFVYDLVRETTSLVSVSSSGVQGNGASHTPAVSADGRYVAFSSEATNLVSGDSNGKADVFVRDTQLGTTVRGSVSSGGAQGNGNCWDPSLSGDGRYVAFRSDATNLVAGGGAQYAVYVHDFQTGDTICASRDVFGNPATGWAPSLSANGQFVTYYSDNSALVANDTNNLSDVFVHEIC